ncbi:MAG: YebY family protein [Actinomycetota bacterium]|nr:YebY family protein [Actinomycetota bacterium]
MRTRAVAAVGAVALALAGCSEAPPQSHSAPVSRAEWQGHPDSRPWPFTVDEGDLTCHPPNWVTFRAGGQEYALTDDARWLGHYEDVKAILAPGYVEIGTERQPVPVELNRRMVDRGRELCPANH